MADNDENETSDSLSRSAREEASAMKISDLKLKLMAMGVLTTAFVEKSEFVDAYVQALLKKEEQKDTDEDGPDDAYDEEALADYPPYVVRRVDELRKLEEEREKIMSGYLAERAALEAKYKALCKPLFDKRRQIVTGDLDDNIAKENGDALEKEENTRKGIPQFWVCVLGQNDIIAEMLSEDDVECLQFLMDVTCDDDADGRGFSLSFHFAPNDYFSDAVLTKEYSIPNLLLEGEPILKNVTGCDIHWKEGRCLTHKEEIRKQKGTGKNAGQVRTVTKRIKTDSFFHFFAAPEIPSLDTMDEQKATALEEEFNADFEIALAFRSCIIPKAVSWFSGEAAEEGMIEAIEEMEWPSSK